MHLAMKQTSKQQGERDTVDSGESPDERPPTAYRSDDDEIPVGFDEDDDPVDRRRDPLRKP
jgi:hypothetical protein